jgi:hypothetical protein
VVSSAIELPPPAERRPKPRRRVLLGAIVTWSDGARSFGCMIRNLSESGARITVPPNQGMPAHVYLINLPHRIAYEAQIVWNNGAEAGVAFFKSIPLDQLTDPALNYLKRLWQGSSMR